MTDKALIYPKAKKSDFQESYHGVVVYDPYQWLENSESSETIDWIRQENSLSEVFFNQIPFRKSIYQRLKKIWNYEKHGNPFKRGQSFYFHKNNGLDGHPILYRQLDDSGLEVFLDPNKFSEDGTTSLSSIVFSKDGTLAAYQISEGGSDSQKILVMRASDKSSIDVPLIDVKFSQIAWKGNEGFFYSSYASIIDGDIFSGSTQCHKLYYHKIGTPQSNDILIFGREMDSRRYVVASITEDERFLIIIAANSTSENELYIKDLEDNTSQIINLVDNFNSYNVILDNVDSKLYILTNLDAPNFKIVTTESSNPSPAFWKDFVQETENVLSASTGGGKIFARYLKDATSTILYQYDMDGNLEREIQLPSKGTVYGFGAKKDDTDIYYTFTSYICPPSVYKYNIATGSSALFRGSNALFDCEKFESYQVFYYSKDGTKIPMTITHKKGIVLNGKNPTLLYGYGGFGTSITPVFNISNNILLENGGIYAVPNLRGGGEYGKGWHLGGRKLKKQNVIDDFIGAAEYLINNEYTSKEYLAISGNSNGGLLVGATIVQRPDLCKVAFSAVGVMDLLRYNKFTVGAGWTEEYGTPEESKEMFEYLLKYSPYQALKPGYYPATLITTGDHDDRVIPAHSYKFSACLQGFQQGPNPIIIIIESKAGHGAGRSTEQLLRHESDKWAFLFFNMGVKVQN